MSPRFIHYIKVAPFIVALWLAVGRVTLPVLALLIAAFPLWFIPVKCPECGKRVDYNPTRIFMNYWAYTVCVPKRCTRCRHSLSNGWDRFIP